MAGRRATLVAILGVILVACSADAQPTPSQQASPDPSQVAPLPAAVTPSPTVAPATPIPDPTITPTADPTAAPRTLGPDMVAVVVTNNLVIKDEPGTGKRSYGSKPWLQRRDQLYVLRGPVRASDYDWYEVMPLSAKFVDTGWVAATSKSGRPWIKPLAAAPDCPAVPSTVADLKAVSPGLALACFSGVPITVRAQFGGCTPDNVDAMVTPLMFNQSYGPDVRIVYGDPGPNPCQWDESKEEEWGYPLYLDPAALPPGQEVPMGKVAEVTGVFDHPAARQCSWDLEGGVYPDPAGCRQKFLVTRID
jgi:hypothetical protein